MLWSFLCCPTVRLSHCVAAAALQDPRHGTCPTAELAPLEARIVRGRAGYCGAILESSPASGATPQRDDTQVRIKNRLGPSRSLHSAAAYWAKGPTQGRSPTSGHKPQLSLGPEKV
ncbi:hypothetical protein NDU88_002648 [Pleurodeles waltl]|uniref:Secreted protein n=1 Tax=Pleurodeles waltl TaxID=8319 RepID=A0AAV7SDU3_PLEWA|nr:hypothetical protein NDU88_002648 [Pleurodeles waltl]